MITYLISEQFIDGLHTGGMSRKVTEVKNCLRLHDISHQVISDLSEISYNLLLVDPLWFSHMRSLPDSYLLYDALSERTDVNKVLYCTELEVLRWNPVFRAKIFKLFDIITANTNYLRSILKALGARNIYRLVDPTNPYLYRLGYPQDPPLVVAGGQISGAKNSHRVYKIFKELQGTPCQTTYIGGSKLWLGWDTDYNRELENLIISVCDNFHNVVSVDIISYVLSSASIFLLDTIHETSSLLQCESLISGVPSVSGVHPLFKERPGISGCATNSDFIESISYLTQGFTSPPPRLYRDNIRSWSINELGYSAFMDQLKQILSVFDRIPSLDIY